MKILIVGWYGTETIGDRGILASLIKHFSKLQCCEFIIASIYPFYTARTIREDAGFISKIAKVNYEEILNIRIVDSRNYTQFKNEIDASDCIVMGGGPLDDMASMYMVQYAMHRARKKKKRTLLYGIGLNVLKKKDYQKSAHKILSDVDYVIFRDKKSVDICDDIGIDIAGKYSVSIDPAVFSCVDYKMLNVKEQREQYCAINLREFPSIYSNGTSVDVDAKARELVCKFTANKELAIVFVPMNYFDAGKDDRIILNRLVLKYPNINARVIKKPLSLEETFQVFLKAQFCVGMRFHAVVFQTLLNGNNYILDYTDPLKGKIGGFIDQINGTVFYNNRIVALQSLANDNNLVYADSHFVYDKELIDNFEKIYIECLKENYV